MSCYVLSLGQNRVGFQTEQHIKQIAARWRGSQIPQISQMLRRGFVNRTTLHDIPILRATGIFGMPNVLSQRQPTTTINNKRPRLHAANARRRLRKRTAVTAQTRGDCAAMQSPSPQAPRRSICEIRAICETFSPRSYMFNMLFCLKTNAVLS